MKELTEKQQQVLRFIRQYTAENSCPPTVREAAGEFSVSLKAIQDHISALRKKGYLSQADKKSRSLKILISDEQEIVPPAAIQVPVLGRVAAGCPIFCEENYESFLPLSEPLIRKDREYFALNVYGKSMINAGILDGDTAVIERRSTAHNGQIVVALIDDENATLKRYFRESSRIRLEPENPDFNPIYCQEVKILGVLAAVLRTY